VSAGVTSFCKPATLDETRKHGPVHWNPLIADALFRANYCQRAGTGTTDMIRESLAAGLPEPSFAQRGPEFVVTLWRDLLTRELLARLALNERQHAAIALLKSTARLTSAEYQRLTGASRQTASRDLDDLVQKGVLERVGSGRGTFYARATRMPRK
jgi:predicted HTH transcriptional regulator